MEQVLERNVVSIDSHADAPDAEVATFIYKGVVQCVTLCGYQILYRLSSISSDSLGHAGPAQVRRRGLCSLLTGKRVQHFLRVHWVQVCRVCLNGRDLLGYLLLGLNSRERKGSHDKK